MATVTLTWTGQPISFDYGFAMSVQKEFGRSEDGSILNEKHTINIRGQIIASGPDADARYSNLTTQMFSRAGKLATGANRVQTLQSGLLIVTGDSGEIVKYDSASLMSINVSEAPEDTAGLHYQEVSMVFESYNVPSDPVSEYKIRSASETIEYKKEENQFAYLNNNIDTEDEPYYAFTVTHNISAQGLVNNGTTKREAFEEAYRYVTNRKKDSLGTINTDGFGASRTYIGSSKVEMKEYKIAGQNSDVVSDVTNYSEYNKIRTSSVDIAAGSYSLTTIYTLSRQDCTIEFSSNYNRDDGGDVSISIEGTIQGLSSKDVDSPQHDKISKARNVFDSIIGNLKSGSKVYSLAQKIYDKYQKDKNGIALADNPLNYSFGENKNAGTITFNVSYKVYPEELKTLLSGITGALTASAVVKDSNRYNAGYDINTIVEIPIIGRASGPIIQDMSTTKRRTRSLDIDVTVDLSERKKNNTTIRSQVLSQVNAYKPTSTDLYIDDFQENWNWTTGQYTLNLIWTYVP